MELIDPRDGTFDLKESGNAVSSLFPDYTILYNMEYIVFKWNSNHTILSTYFASAIVFRKASLAAGVGGVNGEKPPIKVCFS